jgi:hypothetical protein
VISTIPLLLRLPMLTLRLPEGGRAVGAHVARLKLTKSAVDRVSPAAADYVVWDATLPGFGLRVKPSGVKSYIVQYRNRKTGASRRKTIGQHGPLLTFHKARERARIILADALKGNDPIEDDRTRRAAPTVKELASDYLQHHALPKSALEARLATGPCWTGSSCRGSEAER